MALKKKTTVKIGRSVRRFINWLRYRAVGPHVLSKKELKDLIDAGYIKQSTGTSSALLTSYLDTHAQAASASGGTVAPKSMRDGAVEFLERMFDRYAEKAGQELEADILTQVENALRPFPDGQEGQKVYEVLKDKDFYRKNLARTIKDKVENGAYRWKTIVRTELNRASNWGAMDAIVHNNKQKPIDDIYVYKVGNDCNLACAKCCEFWLMPDGVTPKVYRLSELIVNGSNIGKKQADWKPTVDSTHPSCSHVLNEIRPGYGFVNGKLEYVSKDHSEIDSKKS